jgi:hypothetical protein
MQITKTNTKLFDIPPKIYTINARLLKRRWNNAATGCFAFRTDSATPEILLHGIKMSSSIDTVQTYSPAESLGDCAAEVV